MAIPATQIRRGMVIVFEGEPCRVIEFRHHTPGNLRAMVQAKLKNLRTGSSFEHRFRAADSIASLTLWMLDGPRLKSMKGSFSTKPSFSSCAIQPVTPRRVPFLFFNVLSRPIRL